MTIAPRRDRGSMRGYVPTPEPVVDLMVDKLLAHRPPRSADRLLDPGCGPGAFIAGVLRGCARRGLAPPRILGVEEHAAFAAEARARFSGEPAVQIHHRDFLAGDPGQFEHVVGNPPYVPITGLSEAEKSSYLTRFQTDRGRFDLYLLFFEQALAALAPGAGWSSSPPRSSSTWRARARSAARSPRPGWKKSPCCPKMSLRPWSPTPRSPPSRSARSLVRGACSAGTAASSPSPSIPPVHHSCRGSRAHRPPRRPTGLCWRISASG